MAAEESLVLNDVALNDGTDLDLVALDLGTPAKRLEWAQGADSDGGVLVRDPLSENRVITCRLQVTPQATMDRALGVIAQITGLLEEAEQHDGGLPLVWTPADATHSITFYVLTGELDPLPIDTQGDGAAWFSKAPVFTVKMTCKPFGYGEWTNLAGVSGSGPVVTQTITGVPGDVPAEAVLTLTDQSGNTRRYVEWGLEQRDYNPATSLLIDSDQLVVTGFEGVQYASGDTTVYDPGAPTGNVIQCSLTGYPSAVAGTGALTHTGTFRVKARVETSPDNRFRLAWQDGDGPYRAGAWTAPPPGAWSEIDLGTITVESGSWRGRLEAYGAGTIHLDYVILVPAGEGYGRARAAAVDQSSGVIVAVDDFTGATGGTALAGRAAARGGTWATAHAGTSSSDYTLNDSGAPYNNLQVVRSGLDTAGSTGVLATLDGTSLTACSVSAQVATSARLPSANHLRFGVACRYTSATQYVRAYITTSTAGTDALIVEKVNPGSTQLIGVSLGTIRVLGFYRITLSVTATGLVTVSLADPNGANVGRWTAIDADLATGGPLASGLCGLYDNLATGTAARFYDGVVVSVPQDDPVVMYSTQSMRVTSSTAERENATGTLWGGVPSYWGSWFTVPPAGPEHRVSRVLVKAHRMDVEAGSDVPYGDLMLVQISYRPRWTVVPGG